MGIAGIAIGVAPSQGQTRDVAATAEAKPAAQPTKHGRRHVRAAANAPGIPLPRQKPSVKKSEKKPETNKTETKQAPAQPPARPEFTAADEAAAQIPGMPDARFFADALPDFQRALPAQAGPWLILSTGGEEGAYGAGFLNGWLQTGSRPQFAVVTGVSTGALMATYVFAGPQFAEDLHQVYSTISATDIFEV